MKCANDLTVAKLLMRKLNKIHMMDGPPPPPLRAHKISVKNDNMILSNFQN